MKKIFSLIFIILLIFISHIAFAEDYSGYIFRIKEDTPVLFSADGISCLDDNLYVAESEEDIYNFVSSENIVTMFPDYTLELFDTDYPYTTNDSSFSSQWALGKIESEYAREKGVFGKGIKIGIIDSGLNVNHADLNKELIVDAYNCINGSSDVTDNVGHGTHVAGIIAAQVDNGIYTAGIAPDAYICPIKVTDTSSFSISALYPAIKKAIELECDILNMSLGGKLTNSDAIAEMNSWIKKAQNAGIIIVAAAGNYAGTELCYPAACENVIGVGGVDSYGNLYTNSQRNTSVYVSAPGVSILSLSRTNGTAYKSGTSMACPHVVATVALIKELYPQSDISYIKQLLKETSVDHGDTGYDTSFGYGVVNIKNILNEMTQYFQPLVISYGKQNSDVTVHVHNNSYSGGAGTYFASYSDGVLSGIKATPFESLPLGVTNITWESVYEKFYFWNDKLSPFKLNA